MARCILWSNWSVAICVMYWRDKSQCTLEILIEVQKRLGGLDEEDGNYSE